MVETQPFADRRADAQPARHLVWLRTGLLAAWLVGTLLVGVVGEHRTGFSGLDHAIRTGSVNSVAVAGEGLPPEARGSSVQTVHWRDGLIRKFAEVRVQSPDPNSGDVSVHDKIEVLQTRDVGTYLTGRNAGYSGLSVTRTQDPDAYGEVAGWRVPVLLSLFFVFLSVCALIVLVSGPEPWRATRWAWFWIGLTPFAGPLAYLMLGGPLPWVPEPRNPRRRLTGGWALIIYLGLSRL